ncbi:MAG: ATP-binding protein [Candidatus Zixiibacteriota bacterium]
MSYKIKILSEAQYEELVSKRDTALFDSSIKLYLTTILPGLFYSVTDKILNSHDERFLYIPTEMLESPIYPEVFEDLVYKRFELYREPIAVDGRKFFPIGVEGVVVGGVLSDSREQIEGEWHRFLDKFSVSEYFNLIFDINDRLAGGEAIALQVLQQVSTERSPDQFLRSLPSWMVEFLGGGMAAFYYSSGEQFILRRMAGQIGHYEETPPVLDGDAAKEIKLNLTEGRLFVPSGAVPSYATELSAPPGVRFALSGKIGDTEYLLNGLIPNITSYSVALFFSRLRHILNGLSPSHFAQTPDWRRIFSIVNDINSTGRSRQDLMEFLLPTLNEFMAVNRLSIGKYYQLENRLEMEGVATLTGTSSYGRLSNFRIAGTGFEKVIETGRYYFRDNLAVNFSNNIEKQLYQEGVRSTLLVPIMNGDNILGILGTGSPMSDNYLLRHLHIIQTLADYLGKVFVIAENKRSMDLYIRQLEEMQVQMTILENLRTIGELAGGVFHDLNNIIGGILGRSQIIANRLEGDFSPEKKAKIENDLRIIEQSAVDSGEILNRLRQLSRQKREQKKVVTDIESLIEDTLEMIKPRWRRINEEKGQKVVLTKELEPDVKVLADQSELREVFTNLLLNALDAIPEGGEIAVRSRSKGPEAIVTLSDTGIGIPPEVMDKIFEPFFTTKGEKGTGLGLAITQRIIKEHGGQLKVESIPQKGTTFTIILPLAEPQRAFGIIGESPEGNAGATRKKRILIISDSSSFRGELSEALVQSHYEAISVDDSEEAIRMSASQKFDLLIIDYDRNGGFDLDFLARIKSFDHKVKAILVSKRDFGASIQELMSRGVDSLITLPFTRESIVETSDNLLGRSQAL